ncbi:hypothetical protein ACFL5N_02545 [bacterium]
MDQEKADRFKRLAYKRKEEIIEKLRILGNCSNKGSYEYTDEEIEGIFNEILEQFYKVKIKFKGE